MLTELLGFTFKEKYYDKADFVGQNYLSSQPNAILVFLPEGELIILPVLPDGTISSEKSPLVKNIRYKKQAFPNEYLINSYVTKGLLVKRDSLHTQIKDLGDVVLAGITSMQDFYYELNEGSDIYRIVTRPQNGRLEDRVVFEVNGQVGTLEVVEGRASHIHHSPMFPYGG